MLIVRWLALFLLLASAVSFGFYVATGRAFYRRLREEEVRRVNRV